MLTCNFEYKTLEQIADEITDTAKNGATVGFERHTAEYIAAAYALDAITEVDAPIDEDNINAHLEVLKEAGAIFDQIDALNLALSQNS
ncbi:TPA: hypothetical protein ACX6QP_002184 [Photobacterium damselae]